MFKNWNFIRWVRLAIGLLILAQGFISGEVMYYFLGGLFTLMPLLNVGCCATGNCRVDSRGCDVKRPVKKDQNITYEEVS